MTAVDVELGGAASLVGVFLFLTTLTTALRFVERFKAKDKILLDDYCVAFSWIGFVGISAALIYGMCIHFYGYPEPKSTAEVNDTHPHIELATFAINFLDAFALGTNKLSALFFYRRIFCTKVKRTFFDYLTAAFIGIVLAWIITFCIMPFNICGSHSTIHWGIEPGHSADCKLSFPYLLGLTISDFILDVLIVSIPLLPIWQISMQTCRKIAVAGILLIALAGVGASCARMIIYIESINLKRRLDNEDGYQINTKASYYAVLEVGLSLVCVNLPSLTWLRRGLQPDKVAQSLRSFVSLTSLRGRASGRSGSEPQVNESDAARGLGRMEISSIAERADGKTEPRVLERAQSEV